MRMYCPKCKSEDIDKKVIFIHQEEPSISMDDFEIGMSIYNTPQPGDLYGHFETKLTCKDCGYEVRR